MKRDPQKEALAWYAYYAMQIRDDVERADYLRGFKAKYGERLTGALLAEIDRLRKFEKPEQPPRPQTKPREPTPFEKAQDLAGRVMQGKKGGQAPAYSFRDTWRKATGKRVKSKPVATAEDR